MHGGAIVILLVAAAIAAMVAIEFTYSRTYARQVPCRKRRMYTRGLVYAFMACIGILLIVVVYALATVDARRACAANSLPYMTQSSADVPVVSVRVGDEGPFTTIQQIPS